MHIEDGLLYPDFPFDECEMRRNEEDREDPEGEAGAKTIDERQEAIP